MAQEFAEKFKQESAVKSFDQSHHALMRASTEKYLATLKKGTTKFVDLQNSKKKTHLIKWKTLENLDRYLLDFEANFTRRGGKIVWANDAEEARQEILRITQQHEAKSVLKATSLVCEEIGLFDYLQKNDIDVTETDFGAFVLELLQEKPYHTVKRTLHLEFEVISKLFHEKFGTPIDAPAEQLATTVRDLMRSKYLHAEVGVTGADFLLADTGSIAITENEGNTRLITSFSKVHIAVAGIDAVIPSILDLGLFWPLLSSHAFGRPSAVYNSILSGPRQAHETDGPEEMYVILLDNGRTDLLAEKEQRQGLYCIQCGACSHVCPVYQQIGGHTYKSVYQGPIGALVAPYIYNKKDFNHLSFASPLSGKPDQVCPVNIKLDKMLLLNRKDAIERHLVPQTESRLWKGFAYLMERRRLLDFFGGKTKNFFLRSFFKKFWGKHRELPSLPQKSFSQQWREQQKKKN
ncbi:LUD domain-containing protein [Sphingobacterium deserti]|nr:LUD domain-containing protein [Sphingobacterium deserti]